MEEEAKNEIKSYEIGFLVKSEPDKEELIKILSDNQMPIENNGQISRIKLAYPIKKENFSYFGYLYFSGTSENVEKLSKSLKSNHQILRFIIISKPISEKRVSGAEASLTRSKYLVERHKILRTSSFDETRIESSKIAQMPKKVQKVEALSNEALEKKLEEILK